ncbi:SocA family protein [bacterium]|nr:SocA family protein [bacterium]
MKYQSYNIDVFKVADYILCKSSLDIGDNITNLKLQKLLYYCQGFVLAITGKTLFADDILAWEHGPVVKAVYDKFKCYDGYGIKPNEDLPESYFAEMNDTEIGDIVDNVWEVYGQYSAWKLRNLTHEEPPWRETARNEAISLTKMRSFFTTRLVDE